ncbi:MAG: hypothetical protein KIT72_06915 [Polyangiaceae bacterium]|nr:hypothetical protein [Polyangiaceae bacterium]MCW5790135.1 hypothetical protein [Polyangiaceae bacterium]
MNPSDAVRDATLVYRDHHFPQAGEASGVGALEDDIRHLGVNELIMYLQNRLSSIDSQIDGIIKKQQNMEAIRQKLNEINKEMARLSTEHNKTYTDNDFAKRINELIDQIEALDPNLAAQLRDGLSQYHHILAMPDDGKPVVAGKPGDNVYWGHEIAKSTDYINVIAKQLESSAQMDMIKLQSMSSARATAIQMSTNLLSAFTEGMKSTVGNIGR